jgi:hypothetical protein
MQVGIVTLWLAFSSLGEWKYYNEPLQEAGQNPVCLAEAYGFGACKAQAGGNFRQAFRHRETRKELEAWYPPSQLSGWDKDAFWCQMCWDMLEDALNSNVSRKPSGCNGWASCGTCWGGPSTRPASCPRPCRFGGSAGSGHRSFTPGTTNVSHFYRLLNFLAMSAAIGIIGYGFSEYMKFRREEGSWEILYYGVALMVAAQLMIATRPLPPK